MTPEVESQIKEIVENYAVALFMKGNPTFPQCGFSARAVAILKEYDVRFAGVNVLADGAIREGIKAYSQWPTIPQLYINGEFVGGSDIMIEMHEAGELAPLFEQIIPAEETAASEDA